ncbi:ATP-binding protein [Leptolyngbya sp. AN03gr2]|uniref:ATP-binding protein n=1 Tax=unclassified Leptolyngbya TaxID=2650499 RepID=UPI003D316EC7
MFKLLRYFSITSLIALGTASGLSGMMYRQHATDDLIKFGEHENIMLTRSFANSLWSEFKPFLLSASNLSDEQLKHHSETQRLHDAVRNQTQNLSVVKIKIFDLKGRTIFSTEKDNIGQDYSDRPGFRQGLAGEVATKLDHRNRLNAITGTIVDRQLISSYVPLELKAADGTTQIEGVFELYSDVTPLVAEVEKTQKFVFLISGAIWGGVYLVLFLIVKRADTIIQKQYQLQQQTEASLRDSEQVARQKSQQLESALEELNKTQIQQVQAEKMASLGQMIAGIAHEINNPVNFIHGNLQYVDEYTQQLLNIIAAYQSHYPHAPQELQQELEQAELDFLAADLSRVLQSMQVGSDRIRDLVLALRNFSRLDEDGAKAVDLHEGIDNTLMLLQHRLKATPDRPAIEVIKNYGQLPAIECYPAPLNQVFMNLLSNAIEAIDEMQQKSAIKPGQIRISTDINNQAQVKIVIADNGSGISESVKQKIFDPFFTTKPVGKGTGLGLSISYQIITERHCGTLDCLSVEREGTQFVIQIPAALS